MDSPVPDQLYKAVLVSSAPKEPTTITVIERKKGQPESGIWREARAFFFRRQASGTSDTSTG